MPENAVIGADRIDLRKIWEIVWRGRLLAIVVTLSISLGAVAYALLATKWYRADVLLAPAEDSSSPSIGGQLGGLAALAGVTVGGGDDAEAVAALKSRELARDFVEDLDLLPVLFADEWDAERGQWRDADAEEWPDLRDAVEYLHEDVLSVGEDRQTGLVTLAIKWTDPQVAAEWAAELVRRVNTRTRDRALREAQANVAYLQDELGKTSVVTLQQSIGRLLESELQKLMLARGNDEFAFRIIDRPVAPKEPASPQVVLIVLAGVLSGLILGVFIVLLRHALRSPTDKVG